MGERGAERGRKREREEGKIERGERVERGGREAWRRVGTERGR